MSKPILIIDDEEQFAQMLRDLLQLSGFEAEYCLDPKEALARLQNENFELVITDYRMPQMDGAQFLEAIRLLNPDLPVIMISGLMNMPELIRVANFGVTLVLEKPFKTEELLEHVARFVNAKTPEELSASAMEMEASEIDFQPGSMEFTYPAPAQVLSDASDENKRFLETLWNNASSYRHIPCFAPQGAEVRLVASEVMAWLEQDSESEPARIDLVDTKTEITRKWILERETFPGMLLIDARSSSWGEDSLTLLADWVKFVESTGKDLSMTRILYLLPMGASLDVEKLPLEESLKRLFATDCPVLLSLRERVADTAVYINRFFSPEEKAVMGADLLKSLLHYSWPGDYQELQKVLGGIRSKFETGTILTVDELKTQILVDSKDLDSLSGSLDLAGYLKRRQREYLMMHKEETEDLKDTLLRLGIEDKELDTDAILRDEILVYPDILNNNDNEI